MEFSNSFVNNNNNNKMEGFHNCMKHPPGFVDSSYLPEPSHTGDSMVSVSENEVKTAVLSFSAGSAGGLTDFASSGGNRS
jgi:hypothetical protein